MRELPKDGKSITDLMKQPDVVRLIASEITFVQIKNQALETIVNAVRNINPTTKDDSQKGVLVPNVANISVGTLVIEPKSDGMIADN